MEDIAQQVTVAIVARNAEATIGRAVRSAVAAGAQNLLLVDDGSDDRTVAVAEVGAGDILTVVRNPAPVSLGYVRHLALSHIRTPYGLWLDADDEIAEDHINKMVVPLAAGKADLVFSDCVLIDGGTREAIRELTVPGFMTSPNGYLRSFERNWYPSLHAGFRTEFACKVGYDTAFQCVEDYDFLLRALAEGARVAVAEGCSYRYYHYDQSVSRNRAKTAAFTARALEKHKRKDVDQLLDGAGFTDADRACILMSKAMFENDYKTIFELAGRVKESDFAVPSNGLKACDVACFYEGTAALLTGDSAWAKMILSPLGECGEPDTLNNLSVAVSLCGDTEQPKVCLRRLTPFGQNIWMREKTLKRLRTGSCRTVSLGIRCAVPPPEINIKSSLLSVCQLKPINMP